MKAAGLSATANVNIDRGFALEIKSMRTIVLSGNTFRGNSRVSMKSIKKRTKVYITSRSLKLVPNEILNLNLEFDASFSVCNCNYKYNATNIVRFK